MSENEIEFVDGMYFKMPHENAPEFVVGSPSIHKEKMLAWLQGKEANEAGYINLTVKIARSGKPYVAVDSWKPKGQQPAPQPNTQPQQEVPADSMPDGGNQIPF